MSTWPRKSFTITSARRLKKVHAPWCAECVRAGLQGVQAGIDLAAWRKYFSKMYRAPVSPQPHPSRSGATVSPSVGGVWCEELTNELEADLEQRHSRSRPSFAT